MELNNVFGKEILDNIVNILWGSDVTPDVYQRWNQGFVFGDDESTALLQYDGGPCALIVPLQAFILKNLLFESSIYTPHWRQTIGVVRDQLLCEAMADILCQVSDNSFTVCHLLHVNQQVVASSVDTKGQRLSHEEFHTTLRCQTLTTRQELLAVLHNQMSVLSGQYGVLLFLYSVLFTKGFTRIKAEIADTTEPLIDSVHGHGSQSLINLLLTGKAVSHVWDNEKNVSGLKMQGITSRSVIGFLTLLEHLRYCEVGWYLKNPKYPIWLLGSETHLTLLFSQDRSLVGDEGQDAVVRRMFNRFDEDGRGFISVESLGELMNLLDLVSEPDYVKLMAEKLDPEQLGVVTFNSFLDEFYPNSSKPSEETMTSFTVYHYNGLQRIGTNKVVYIEGRCTVAEMPELQMMSDYSPIKTCLLTKWPTIELAWTNGVTPSVI